jgi:hypothetical protein
VSYEEEDSCVSYEEEDTCVSYEEEDTCVSYEEEDTCVSCVSYEEEDTCVSYEEEDTCVSYEEVYMSSAIAQVYYIEVNVLSTFQIFFLPRAKQHRRERTSLFYERKSLLYFFLIFCTMCQAAPP